ncbi:MAG: hypothetical protein SNJ73_05510, partial [Acetobacteraceae bacterium]
MRGAVLPTLLLAAACGSRELPPEPPDPVLARLTRTALAAWRQDRPAQAAELFRDALRRAHARDDAVAIGDLAASLAAAELRLGEAAAARDTAASARAELGRRGVAAPAELPLAGSSARHAGHGRYPPGAGQPVQRVA